MLKQRARVQVLLLIAIGLFIYSPVNAETPTMITHRHHPEEFIQSIQNDPAAGKKIYQQFCSTCHNIHPSIEIGAPRIRVAGDWKLRTKKGVTALLAVTAAGVNQMPPRGGCFECSDDQLKAAIIYMLPPEKKTNHNP